jgi:hypothetical protein
MEPTAIGWVAAAALIVGALVRLLKSDMLTNALASLGLPPIPKRVLPWLALAFGLASSILDEKVMGTPWPAAITKGVLAALGAITGHELTIESLRKGKELLVVCLAIGSVLTVGACSARGREVALVDGAKIALCVAEHQDEPTELALIKCGSENVSPDDIRKMLEANRAATNRAAVKRLGCHGATMTDAGAP